MQVPESRRAAVYLYGHELVEYLDLPAGTRVRSIEAQQDPVGFRVIVEHESLEPVMENCEAPTLHVMRGVETDADGNERHVRRYSIG